MLFSSESIAQLQDSQWIFGDHCWVDFSENSPQEEGEGHFFGNEGVVSISDDNGNLLFSSNGEQVFDRNGQVMPNGEELGGHVSSTQGALIVPLPGDLENRIYYMFTVSAEAGRYTPSHTGLEYVVIDMSFNNGLGDVSEPTSELVANTGEKLHATWHQNKRDVWIVTHTMDDQNYHAFLLTCDGIEEHVVSSTGKIHTPGWYGTGCLGALKLSPDGSKIASNYNGIGEIGDIQLEISLEVGSFNNESGEVEITQFISKVVDNLSHGYGIEFSPNNQMVYWSIFTAELTLFQYNLNELSLEEGEYSFQNLSDYPHAFAALQLAPNGKIYIARAFNGTRLSAINSPNEPGALCEFIEVGVELSQSIRFGLPNQWMYPYPTPDSNVTLVELTMCEEGGVTLDAPSSLEGPILWNTGQSTRHIEVHELGDYWVTTTECVHDTVFFTITSQDFCICEVFTPNSFTPDGDDLNEEFGGVSWCEYKEYKFQVFDRWGHKLFESSDPNVHWNGTFKGMTCPTGVYAWRCDWKDPYASESSSYNVKFGSVSLLR